MQHTLDDFLPMPSLSITSSAHCIWRCSEGSARRRNVPEGRLRRRTGDGRVCMVVLPAEGPMGCVADIGLAIARNGRLCEGDAQRLRGERDGGVNSARVSFRALRYQDEVRESKRFSGLVRGRQSCEERRANEGREIGRAHV